MIEVVKSPRFNGMSVKAIGSVSEVGDGHQVWSGVRISVTGDRRVFIVECESRVNHLMCCCLVWYGC